MNTKTSITASIEGYFRSQYYDHKKQQAEAVKSPVLLQLVASHKAIGETLRALDQFNRSQSPTRTTDAHRLEVARMSEKAIEKIKRSSEYARNSYASEVDRIDSEIKSRTNLRETSHAAEIRAVLREMSYQDRIGVIGKAIETKDGVVMGAVLGAHAILSGLQDQHLRNFEKAYTSKHAGDLVDARESIMETCLELNAAEDFAVRTATVFKDPAELERIERAERSAEAARDALEQVVIE